MIITLKELVKWERVLHYKHNHTLAVCLAVLVILLGFTFIAFGGGVSDSHSKQAKEWGIKKFVLEEGCSNPIENALVILYRHENQYSPGVEIHRGYTNHYGWVALGEWPEGYWYSINASFEGQWSHDPPFYLQSDKVLYNYLTLPAECLPWRKR